MSWDANLYEITPPESCPACGHELRPAGRAEPRWWNYTHNTNGMIAASLEAAAGEATPACGGPLGTVTGPRWWGRLDGASGKDGAAYLTAVIEGLRSDPDRFRAMNPANGWGDYDGLLCVLEEMRDAVPQDRETVWDVSG